MNMICIPDQATRYQYYCESMSTCTVFACN